MQYRYSAGIKVSKNGPVPGLRPLQNGISSHRDRFSTFSRRIQEQEKKESESYLFYTNQLLTSLPACDLRFCCCRRSLCSGLRFQFVPACRLRFAILLFLF